MDGGKLLLGLVGLGVVGAAALGSSSNANAATPPAPPRPPAGGGAAPPPPPPPPPAGGGAPPAPPPPPPNPYGPGGGTAPPAPPPPPPPAGGGSSGASTGGAQPIGGTYTPPGGSPQDVPTGGTAGAPSTPTGAARYPRQDPRRLPSSITSAKVRFAQGVLRGLNFNVTADGAWGPRMSDAVLAFQGAALRQHPTWPITTDGVLGPRTLSALAYYFLTTPIGYQSTWNALGSGLPYNQARTIAEDARDAQPFEGLDLGPARW